MTANFTPPVSTFKRDREYSIMEIRAASHECEEPKDYFGVVNLVARAFDGREYWFTQVGWFSWKVDHTWGSFELVKQPQDKDSEAE